MRRRNSDGTFNVPASEYHTGTAGICLACGEVQSSGVEPDAEGYVCESYKEPRVCGLEQAMLMGEINVVDDG